VSMIANVNWWVPTSRDSSGTVFYGGLTWLLHAPQTSLNHFLRVSLLTRVSCRRQHGHT